MEKKDLLEDLLSTYENKLSKAEVKYVKAVGKRAGAYERIKVHRDWAKSKRGRWAETVKANESEYSQEMHDLTEKIALRHSNIMDIQNTIKTIKKLK